MGKGDTTFPKNKARKRGKSVINMKYAADLHRQGRTGHVMMMENKARNVVRESKGGLAHAFLTTAYYGADCFAIIANDKAFEKQTGYVLWDEELDRAVFVGDDADEPEA